MAKRDAHGTALERALNAYARGFQRWLPSPFTIAVVLTVLAVVLAMRQASAIEVMDAWARAWNPGLIRFGFQAMFMLVLGHVLALAPVLRRCTGPLIGLCCLPPCACQSGLAQHGHGWLNWGLGLIAGAILVRGVMDRREAEVPALGSPTFVGRFGCGGVHGIARLAWGTRRFRALESGGSEPPSLVPNADWVAELPEALTLGQTALTGWSQTVTWTVVVQWS